MLWGQWCNSPHASEAAPPSCCHSEPFLWLWRWGSWGVPEGSVVKMRVLAWFEPRQNSLGGIDSSSGFSLSFCRPTATGARLDCIYRGEVALPEWGHVQTINVSDVLYIMDMTWTRHGNDLAMTWTRRGHDMDTAWTRHGDSALCWVCYTN